MVRPFYCPECAKFVNEDPLKQRTMIVLHLFEIGEDEFRCPICGTSVKLNNHDKRIRGLAEKDSSDFFMQTMIHLCKIPNVIG